MKLTFYGGVGEVTGSNYFLNPAGRRSWWIAGCTRGATTPSGRILSRFRTIRRRLRAVFVTHSHLDHTGRLPSLVQAGFKGTIYSTRATKDFAELMLLDSEHILEQEAEREERPPLYTTEDIMQARQHWEGLRYHAPVAGRPFHGGTF